MELDKLKYILEDSSNITYEDVLKELNNICRDVELDDFIDVFIEKLEHNKIVNEAWDLTKIQIVNKYNSDMNYWNNVFESSNDFKDCYGTVENFKENMLDWMFTYSLDGAYEAVKTEVDIC